MALLRGQRNDFIALIGATAERMGIRPVFVEKDYWVTELLRSVVAPVKMPSGEMSPLVPIFKGGTSLSKVYRLIERFSEDVDVLLSGAGPASGPSKSAREKTMSLLASRAAADTAMGGPNTIRVTGPYLRKVGYVYEPTQPHDDMGGGMGGSVQLDLGVQGGPEPHEKRRVSSYISEYALEHAGVDESEFGELASFEVNVLKPERTLVEKLMCLHSAASGAGSEDDPSRVVRHYYDVNQLLHSNGVLQSIREAGTTVPELAERVEASNREWNFDGCDRPPGGFAASPAFQLGGAWTERSRSEFDATLGQLAWGDYPTFDECIGRVHEMGAAL